MVGVLTKPNFAYAQSYLNTTTQLLLMHSFKCDNVTKKNFTRLNTINISNLLYILLNLKYVSYTNRVGPVHFTEKPD
jgi:hypothetical protein